MGKKYESKQHKEVYENFEVFQKMLPKLMKTCAGKHALMRKQKIVEFFDTFIDAHKAGKLIFKDLPFSIQQVTDEVVCIY